MPAVVPILVTGAVATGTAAAIGTAIAGAAISTAVATGIGAAVVGTGAALATGQKPSDALKTGVVSGLTAGVGSSIGSALAGGSAMADAAFVATDASRMAAMGLNEAAIAQNLVASGVSQATAQTAATLALSGATESAIASSLGKGSLFDNAPISQATPYDPGYNYDTFEAPGYTDLTKGDITQGISYQGDTSLDAPRFYDPMGDISQGISYQGDMSLDPNYSAPSSTISVQQALRGANLANQLLNPPEFPGMPMDGGQQPRLGGVDYSGLLGLLQTSAGTPNVAGLLGPAQIRYPSSLLG
jgi:hypothetical protein